ncbi:MAG: 23S rRNA pseudouridine(955/2504/2580) synthase RluC [Cellvibrionaceae bacterium]|nr:23S rRNA pseudouridine(955/2504/2580) synthase RluC [Cellvibrionaceae bacterium]
MTKTASECGTATAVQLITIDADRAGQRVDNFLLSRLKGVPKSLIYKILRKGEVRVNKGRIKPDYKLAVGDLVRVPPVRLPTTKTQASAGTELSALLSQAVLYEDEGLLIINKPSGLAVHGGSGVRLGLIEALRQIRATDSLELVHRLDRETSGCVMVAKNRQSLRHLQDELRQGRIDKTYHALVAGHWPKRRHSVNMPLLKNQLSSGERMVKAVAEGVDGAKPALTRYRILQAYDACTLVEAKPITGRTHQIRVHSRCAGHPILGDPKYGDREADHWARSRGLQRLFLHAYQLELVLSNRQTLRINAPLPQELALCLQALVEQ